MNTPPPHRSSLASPALSSGRVALTVPLLLALTACSSPGSSGSSAGGDGGGGASSTSSASSTASSTGSTAASSTSSTSGTGGPMECSPGRGFGGGEKSVMVGTVEATVRDTKGAAVAASPIQLCGIDACLYGVTDAGGHVLVSANKTLKAPAFKYGDGLHLAKFAVPITMASTVLTSVTTVALPETGVPFLSGGEAVSGGVRLSLPAGGAFVVDDLDYPKPEDQRFRAAALTAAQAAPAFDPSLGIAIVYGAAPIGTRFCPPAQITLPNSENWPAGTEVEFLIHGLDTSQEDAPYGGWATASSGKVSADGAQILTDPTGGLQVLSTFGVRKKP